MNPAPLTTHAACNAAVVRALNALQRHRATADAAGDLANEGRAHLLHTVEGLSRLFPVDVSIHSRPWFRDWAGVCALDYALAFALRTDLADWFRQLREQNAQFAELLAACYAGQAQAQELATIFGLPLLELYRRVRAAWEALCALIREQTGTEWDHIYPVPPLLR